MRPLEVAAPGGIRAPLDPALAGVRASEEAGFDAVWWSDHFLHRFPPAVWTPEYGRALATLDGHAADAGRAPEDITAGLFAWIVVDEDREAAERMLDNLLLRLVALTAPAEDFVRAGGEPPLAEGWGLLHYVPTQVGREEALRLAAAVPAELLRSYYMWGTPDDIVERLRGFREAGLEHVYFCNVTGLGDMTKAAGSTALLGDIMHGLRRLP